MSVPPQNWPKEALKRRVRFAYGDSLASENRNDGDVPVFGSNGVVGNHDRSITRAPVIVIGRKGSSGKVTWSDIPCFPIDTTYFVDQTQTRENIRWLFYALESLELNKINFDSAVPGLSRELAYSLPLVFPPLPEQQRIAAYLDASCAAIDAAVGAKRNQLGTLDALRKSIIQRAVTRGISAHVTLEATGNAWLEQIPSGWKLVCLKRIAVIQGGLTLGKHYEGPLIERPYLRVGNVQDGHLDLTDVSVIELPAGVAAGVELRPDDVLMTEGGDLDKLGRGHLWHGEIPGCLHQNHIFAVRCFPHKLKPMFLAYVTAAKYGRDYFEATGKKTTNLANTNATKVGQFPIPLPPPAEQEIICAHLDEKTAELNRIVATIESQIATLTAYRKSLIHECVTGQRRITEADVVRTQNKQRPT
jgi:type I restriction enzyme S subunit